MTFSFVTVFSPYIFGVDPRILVLPYSTGLINYVIGYGIFVFRYIYHAVGHAVAVYDSRAAGCVVICYCYLLRGNIYISVIVSGSRISVNIKINNIRRISCCIFVYFKRKIFQRLCRYYRVSLGISQHLPDFDRYRLDFNVGISLKDEIHTACICVKNGTGFPVFMPF